MNDAWWWNSQPGGSLNSGSPPFSKFVVRTVFAPPYEASTTLPNSWNAFLISGEVHFSLPDHHWSYLAGPAERRTMSSIQSVPGQPDAAPDSRPTHQVWSALPLFAAAAVVRASHVLGGSAW